MHSFIRSFVLSFVRLFIRSFGCGFVFLVSSFFACRFGCQYPRIHVLTLNLLQKVWCCVWWTRNKSLNCGTNMVSIVDYRSFVVSSNEFAKKTQDVLPEPFRGGLTTVPALRPVGHGIMESWNGKEKRVGGWIVFWRISKIVLNMWSFRNPTSWKRGNDTFPHLSEDTCLGPRNMGSRGLYQHTMMVIEQWSSK